MQSEANLTLEKAKTMAPQKEAIAEQNVQLRDGSKQSPILLGQVRGNLSSKPQSRRRDTAVRSDEQSTVKDAAPAYEEVFSKNGHLPSKASLAPSFEVQMC